jgi:hypothetical protein
MAKAKLKIPKEVAGVKVPKELRREAKRALKLADSPAVRELAVAGLTIAAQSVLDKARAARVKTEATSIRPAKLDVLELGDMLRAAAMEGARRFLEGFEQGQAANRTAPAAPGAAAKPKARAAVKPKAKATAKPKPKATAKPKKPTPRRPAAAS